MFTTAVTQAEILYGLEKMPVGRRRADLVAAVARMFVEIFHDRVLPFDAEAAGLYPAIVGRERMGRPIGQLDALIASICRSRGAVIATRNVRDFEDCGISVVNPWIGD